MAMKLWTDDSGFIVSSELVLIATMLVIAMVVGLQTVRDAVLQELGDVGEAIGNVVQTYSYSGATGHHSSIHGSRFVDDLDNCEDVSSSVCNDRNCLNVCTDAITENGVLH